jgi:eukaryotic-like serine/threonine-protein kinase
MIGERTSIPATPPLARLPESFGFGAPEDAWLDIARRAAAPTEPGFLGSYRVLGRVGAGGQGVVFRAVQPGTGRIVALKRLAAGRFADAESVARVRREVEATVALNHPGIVTLHGVEIVDGLPILVMEFVDGVPIHRWAHPTQRKRPLRERLAAFLQCCDAIAFAHSRGVIHCDIKPGNVLVDTSGRVRIVDFGLARLQDNAATTTGFRGTPAYAPPEQLARRGHIPDSRSDVYSLGAVLYVLVTGKAPFDPRSSVADLIDAVRTQPPAPFPCRDLTHRELRVIIHKTMAKSPEERYQSVHALASDVRRLLDGRPVLAHPPSAAYQLRAFVRRRPIACGVSAAALLAIVGLAVASTALAVSLEHRRQQLGRALLAADQAAAESQAQAAEAKRARTEAEAEAKRAMANAEFMQRVLEDMGAAVQFGEARPDPILLQEARERLESEQLDDQPEVKAVLWRTLCHVYLRFGRPAMATEPMELALKLHQQAFGAEHAETGRCCYVAGLLAENLGQMERAEVLDREAYRVLSAALGEVHTETAQAGNNLGCVLKNLGKYEEAERCHQQALAIWTEVHGENHRQVAISLRNLGSLERARGAYDEAETYYERAMQTAIASCTARDPVTDSIRLNIARLRTLQGSPQAAEQIIRPLIQRQLEFYGAGSPQLGKTYVDLAYHTQEQGKTAEAIGHLRAARVSHVAGSGEGSLPVWMIDERIGRLSAELGDVDAARESFLKALDAARQLGREDLESRVTASLEALERAGPAAEQDDQPE